MKTFDVTEDGFASDDYDQARDMDGAYESGEGRLRAPSDADRESRESAETTRAARHERATTAISILAYVAALAAIFMALSDSWRVISETARFAALATILAVTYGIALAFRRFAHALPSNVFFLFGALFLGLALVFIRAVEAPNDSTAPEVVELLSDGIDSVFAVEESLDDAATRARDFAGFWAIGVFLLALSLPSIALHILATLTLVCWWTSCPLDYTPPTILIFCVLGEMWAWRRRDRVIAMLYVALGICVLFLSRSLWQEALAPLLTTLFAAIIFWIGATFKNAIARGTGLALGGLGLGWMTFPQYWQSALPTLTSRFGYGEIAEVDSRVSTALSLIFCAIFILFALNMIFSGAARSRLRMLYGMGLAILWLFTFAGVELRVHGPRVGAFTMLIGAFVFFAAYEIEVYLERVFGEPATSDRGENAGAMTTTDSTLDDPEFDDPIDREARENATRGLTPFEILRDKMCAAFLARATPIMTAVAIGAQFVFLYLASFIAGK